MPADVNANRAVTFRQLSSRGSDRCTTKAALVRIWYVRHERVSARSSCGAAQPILSRHRSDRGAAAHCGVGPRRRYSFSMIAITAPQPIVVDGGALVDRANLVEGKVSELDILVADDVMPRKQHYIERDRRSIKKRKPMCWRATGLALTDAASLMSRPREYVLSRASQ